VGQPAEADVRIGFVIDMLSLIMSINSRYPSLGTAAARGIAYRCGGASARRITGRVLPARKNLRQTAELFALWRAVGRRAAIRDWPEVGSGSAVVSGHDPAAIARVAAGPSAMPCNASPSTNSSPALRKSASHCPRRNIRGIGLSK